MNQIMLLRSTDNYLQKKMCYNPVCYDKTIHIRLKNYKSNMIISGLEAKLLFLVQCLIYTNMFKASTYETDNLLTTNNDNSRDYIFKKYIECFKDSLDFSILNRELYSMFDFDSIIIRPVYSKVKAKNNFNQFGNIPNIIDIKCFLECFSEGIKSFEDALGITLHQYLTDESYAILLTTKDLNPSKKFQNKAQKKLDKKLYSVSNYSENNLWCD